MDLHNIKPLMPMKSNEKCALGVVGISTPSERELVAETADAYCPECDDYIVNERVTYEECCDTCGTEIEWHE